MAKTEKVTELRYTGNARRVVVPNVGTFKNGEWVEVSEKSADKLALQRVFEKRNRRVKVEEPDEGAESDNSDDSDDSAEQEVSTEVEE